MNPFSFLDGYKTIIGGVGLLGLGIYTMTQGDMQHGLTYIAGAFTALGFGGKLDKLVASAPMPATPGARVATGTTDG